HRLGGYLGGGLGKGIDKNIEDAYLFLCLNYVSGDEIYLFGFSRGAYTVRSLAGLIYNAGLLTRSYIRKAPEAYQLYQSRDDGPQEPNAIAFRQKYGARVPITLLGCWDTVGSLGIPDINPLIKLDRRINEKYRFHDTQLNRTIQHALHAVAIDETRKVFDVTPMQPSRHSENQIVKQVWFPGDHGSVGGGMGDLRGLSDAALQWIIDSIANWGLGLDFDLDRIEDGILVDPTIPLNLARKTLIGKLTALAGSFLREVSDNFEDIHEVAIQRFLKRSDYKPQNLLQKHRSRLTS
ncbi:MAG: DUF2235 domain-containing protein, partial [Leptolyngbya sp. SIO1D8]|nr:DUF2235 domain-containing protein [Leptolyngbya sp. SIO1D8]